MTTPAARSDRATKLQLALDDIERGEVYRLIEHVADQIDIVEVGTPLVIRYGIDLVTRIKQRFEHLEVLCDAKIVDAAYYEARLAFDAGADYVTILALTDNASIVDAVRAAADHGARIMADMICVTNLPERARELQDMGVDVVAVHTGVDQQARGRTPLDDLRLLSTSGLSVPLAVAGGVNRETAPAYLALKPRILIVGSGITTAPDAPAEAAAIRCLIEGSRQ